MLDSIKTLFGSKKFLLVILGSAIVGVMQHFAVPQDIILMVGGLFGVNVLGQGLADFGKEAK